MPHLHLPAAHTDADLALAADVASVLGSADLFVAWSHFEGPGAIPEVEAVVREERAINPFAEVFVAMMQGVVALLQAVTRGPAPRQPRTAPAPAPSQRPLEEPSA